MITALLAIAQLLVAVTLAGWVTFRIIYKPWSLRGHSKTGRHLIRTADSMIALLGVSLLQAFVPIPLPVMAVITVLVLAYLTVVAWERVWIRCREQAARRARAAATGVGEDVEDTV